MRRRARARSTRRARRGAGAALAVAAAVAAGGCGGQSTLEPDSPATHGIASLWWWMMAAAWVVFLGAVGLLLASWRRRRQEGLPVLGKDERASVGLVVTFGMVIPLLALVALFVVANFLVARLTDAPSQASTSMTVQVVGHQWFWEVRYPGSRAVTANEIHIPVGARAYLVATTADVIHSFWVPQLQRKVDMIPGRRNRILLYADRPGRYRGQCAELCGLQHAHMGIEVVAESPRAFRAWLADMAAPRRAPSTPPARRGERIFVSDQCASCHTIRGTPARGRIGPDLTHVASRRTLAALTIPNRADDLARWIRDPQHVKPGNKMPALDLSGPQVRDVVAYLDRLR